MNEHTVKSNAIGFAIVFIFVAAAVVIFAAYYYPIDYIFWTYLFSVAIISLTVAYIIWYALINHNVMLAVSLSLLGLIVIILMTYFTLDDHSDKVIVIRPI